MSDVSTTTSGMTGAGGGQTIRITGMASGLDVDALVKKMMAAEQTKLDKVKQAQQLIKWKQEAYTDIISSIKDLQSSFFDSTSSDKNILSSTNFTPFTVSGIGTSTVDTSVATFTPGAGAQAGKYSINVTQLSDGAGVSNILSGKMLSTKLTDINSSLSGSITLNVTVSGVSDPINITLDNTGTSTLGDLVNAINDQGGGNIKASFSELTGKFKLSTVATGSTSELTINSESTDLLSNILGTYTEGAPLTGIDAKVSITPPGASLGTEVIKSSNNFTIDGMTYTLSSVGEATVNIGSDTQKVYDKIKGFIDKYNTIVDKIQSQLTEKKDSDYAPLTDAQKESMTSDQIKAWETKAKVGILRNDMYLQNMLNDLKTAFTSAVSNTGLTLGKYGSNSIGIDTSDDYTTPAHINIADESKLKSAIANNPDQILRMFTNVSKATDGSTKSADGSMNYTVSSTEYREDGIFTRIKTIFENNVGYTNTTLNTAILTSYANKQYDYSSTGSGGKGTLPDQIYEQQLMVTEITKKMSTKQEKYYQQFSALETALTQLSAQQSVLSSMFES